MAKYGYIAPAEVQEIIGSVSVADYFSYLEKQGIVRFERVTGKETYYRTDADKFSVYDNRFFEFHTGEGGQIINAVMKFENTDWRGAIEFLKNFSGQKYDLNNKRKPVKVTEIIVPKIIAVVTPNNVQLLNYFRGRGISSEIITTFAKQVHFELGDKKIFGIGVENNNGGYNVRNPYGKFQVGNQGFVVIEGKNKNQVVIFEGMTDMFSYMEIQLKLDNAPDEKSLICLNSTNIAQQLIEKYAFTDKNVSLCLDSDNAGNAATELLIAALKDQAVVKDIRAYFLIGEQYNDLNDFLQANKFKNHIENITEVEHKKRGI